MKYYEAAELVEFGTAAELVLGAQGEPFDNIAGDNEIPASLYEAAELVELGSAAELVLGANDEPPDNVAGDSRFPVALDSEE